MALSPTLDSRARIVPGRYALIPPDGLVINCVPGFVNCALSIVCSPKLGAAFVEYVGTAAPGGGTSLPYAREEGVEAFLYVLDGQGQLTAQCGGQSEILTIGGYVYAPPGEGVQFTNTGKEPVRFLLYKQRHQPHPDPARKPWTVFGSIHAIAERNYAGLSGMFVRDLLPADEAFAMNFHTLSFVPGAAHPFVETHVQEHGAYIYEGQGLYLLGEEWLGVGQNDFIWFGPFTQQACYAVGEQRLSYVYSKDCNRDVCV